MTEPISVRKKRAADASLIHRVSPARKIYPLADPAAVVAGDRNEGRTEHGAAATREVAVAYLDAVLDINEDDFAIGARIDAGDPRLQSLRNHYGIVNFINPVNRKLRKMRVGKALATLLVSAMAVTPACTIASEDAVDKKDAICNRAGQWINPASGNAVAPDQIMRSAAETGIVLMGENHASLEHHRWQAQTLAGLHALKPYMTIGFEMFPRTVQSALDRWSSGELSQAAFLTESRWSEVWGFDADHYMPLFDLARQNRLPMLALNVDRSLVGRIGREGWSAVPKGERQGVSKPAPASEAYKDSLARVFMTKMQHATPGGSWGEHNDSSQQKADYKPEITVETVMAMESFTRFVEAQLVWDRAMAEALLTAKRADPERLVVGVMGSGHLDGGHGVPHQLAAMGWTDVSVLLPMDTGDDCRDMKPTLADAVFLVAPMPQSQSTLSGHRSGVPRGPRLGVIIETAEAGVRVLRVMDDSVAQSAALAAGDIITQAAGLAVKENSELITIIRRQAPGTWLPLVIRRGDQSLSVVVKFPPTETVAK